MSIIGSNILAGAAGSGVSAYEIEQSLRFDGSSHLNFTPSSSASTRRQMTFSFWSKHDGTYNIDNVFTAGTGVPSGFYDAVYFDQGTCAFGVVNSGNSAFGGVLYPAARLRDSSAWLHYVAVLDTSNATAADRMRIYINGTRVTDFASTPYAADPDPGLNYDTLRFNTTSTHRIGSAAFSGSADRFFSGYLAEVHCVFGSALDPTDFGEYDDNGVWRPIRYTGSYGTNGFYLKFDPSATNGIGHDHSGNGNNFTASGFTTSGTGTDVMSDTPTNNFCTWNPLDNTGVTLKNGNLDFGYAGAQDCGGTFALSSGKWYWEIEVRDDIGGGGQPLAHGIHNASVTSDFRKQAIWFYTDEISAGVVRRYANNSVAASVSIPSALRAIDIGDYLQVAYDADSGKVWFAVNNTWMDGSGGTSGNPGSGSNPVFTLPDTSIPMTPWRSHAGLGWEGFTNFGQRDFQYTPPTGFNGVSTSNLPTPTIKDGSKNFNTVLYTGNGSTQSITGVGFQPDWIWCKTRNSNSKNTLTDAVRGADRQLWSDLTTAEQTNSTDFITSFDSDGFTSGPSSSGTGSTNENNGSFVAWNWLAGNGTSSNTDGTITSTVSANQTAGFSIVSYSGNNNSSATVGHGLGVSPDLVIVKDRSTSNYVWMVKFAILGGNILELNGSGIANAPSSYSTGTIGTLTNTTFGFTTGGSLQAVNNTGQNYIAYCFAEVEGYSKFGSYVGNNSSDGPFVYCGFKPRWIMRKATGDTSNWVILDTARDTYNETDNQLLPNTSGTESDGSDIDILSNGFKMRSAALNGSTTYIFAAFASHPFGGSGVSPATAR